MTRFRFQPRLASGVLTLALAALPVVHADAQPGDTPSPQAVAQARYGAADTLAAIYELALDQDHTLSAARATLRADREEYALGRAGLLPRIEATGSFGNSYTENRGAFPAGGTILPNQTDTDIETITWAVNLDQPVFDLPAWFRFQRGKTLSREAEATFAVAQQDLIVRTAEAYFNVLRARANLRAARAQERAFKAQLEQARERFEVGLIAITDVHEAEAAYDLAVADRLTEEGALGTALEQLTVLTGREHSQLWFLRREIPVQAPTPADKDQWTGFARQHNLDIRAAELSSAAAREAAHAARAEHLPKLNLSFNYEKQQNRLDQDNLQTQLSSEFQSDTEGHTVNLSLNVPLSTGGAISANRRQSQARFNSARESYLGTVRNVEQQTRASYINVMSDVSRIRARRQAIVSNRSALEAARTGYEVGTRDIVDVLDAQRAFFLAIRDYANTRIDYILNNIRLKRQAGTLSPKDIYEINDWLVPEAPEIDAPRAELLQGRDSRTQKDTGSPAP